MHIISAGHSWLEKIALILLVAYTLDRMWKLACIVRFFRREEPIAPQQWPKVSLIQPITRGASGLPHNLNMRAMLDYPGIVQHVLVCDAGDTESLGVCCAWQETWPGLDAQIVTIGTEPEHPTSDTQRPALLRPASKVEKMQAGVEQAIGNVICFIDDDIAPRPDNLTIFVRYLRMERAGGVFGLPCYTNWADVGSSLMSLFVNANALPSYIPLTYLCEPYTITGHFFALSREVFTQSGGLDNMEALLCDDHEIARRIRALGLRIVQTPAIYDANNELPGIQAFHRQILRWFVFSGRVMWPMTSNYERLMSSLFSLASLFPAVLILLALLAQSWQTWSCLTVSLFVAAVLYGICAECFLARHTPIRRWPLLLWVTLVTPWQAFGTLLTGNEVVWRGQRIRVHTDNTYEVLS